MGGWIGNREYFGFLFLLFQPKTFHLLGKWIVNRKRVSRAQTDSAPSVPIVGGLGWIEASLKDTMTHTPFNQITQSLLNTMKILLARAKLNTYLVLHHVSIYASSGCQEWAPCCSKKILRFQHCINRFSLLLMSLVAMFGAGTLFQPLVQVAISRPSHERIFARQRANVFGQQRKYPPSTMSQKPRKRIFVPALSWLQNQTRLRSQWFPSWRAHGRSSTLTICLSSFLAPGKPLLSHVKYLSSMRDYHFKGNCRIIFLPHKQCLQFCGKTVPSSVENIHTLTASR